MKADRNQKNSNFYEIMDEFLPVLEHCQALLSMVVKANKCGAPMKELWITLHVIFKFGITHHGRILKNRERIDDAEDEQDAADV